jgi:glutamine amidotransferase
MGNLLQRAEGARACHRRRASSIRPRSACCWLKPGVGAFGQAMERLHETGFVGLVRDWTAADRPFLGICLGLQLLFSESEEFGPVQGLDVLPGRVVRFSGPAYETTDGKPGLKVPHMGWNRITVVRPHPVVAGLPEGAMTYFVHSYYPVPEDPS